MAREDDLDITQLISSARDGDKDAERALFEMVYNQLRAIAARRRRVGHRPMTMQTTALVNEAYVQFAQRFPEAPTKVRENRATFYRTVGLAMRTILRDYWRMKVTARRGGGEASVPIVDGLHAADEPPVSDQVVDFLALDEALGKLEVVNPRWYEVVLHRHFAGRSIEETAELMELSASAVKKYWRCARAWLSKELGGVDI